MNIFKSSNNAQELRTLEGWLLELSKELRGVKAKEENLEKLINLQGYSLKTIKGNAYLYVCRGVGHAKAMEVSGQYKSKGWCAWLLIGELRSYKVNVLLKEWEGLTQREAGIKKLVIEVLEEQKDKNLMEVAI